MKLEVFIYVWCILKFWLKSHKASVIGKWKELEELTVSFLFQLKESLRSFAPERFESEIQSKGRIHTEGTGYWYIFPKTDLIVYTFSILTVQK